jgi:hypothetical protein
MKRKGPPLGGDKGPPRLPPCTPDDRPTPARCGAARQAWVFVLIQPRCGPDRYAASRRFEPRFPALGNSQELDTVEALA